MAAPSTTHSRSALPTPQYLSGDRAGIEAFIAKYDVFLFDCDGVLWTGETLLPAIKETIEMLTKKGKMLLFVTNNSSKSRADYAGKFHRLGIECVKEEQIFGSSYSSATYISSILKLPAPSNKVFALGEAGLAKELEACGVPYVGCVDPAFRRDITPDDFLAIADGSALDPDVSVVLLGLDMHINYLKLSLALAYLRRGAKLLLTNPDVTLPGTQNSFFPGAGALSAGLIKAAGFEDVQYSGNDSGAESRDSGFQSGLKEAIVLGKPSMTMMDAVISQYPNIDRTRTCMVGDRLDTDILFARRAGLGGALAVLSGVCKKAEFLGSNATIVPDAYLDCLGNLYSS